jgi:hypothetical protein
MMRTSLQILLKENIIKNKNMSLLTVWLIGCHWPVSKQYFPALSIIGRFSVGYQDICP